MNAQEKKPGTEPGTKERLIDAIKEYDDLAREVAEILAEEIRTAQRQDVPTIRLVDEMAQIVFLDMTTAYESLKALLESDDMSKRIEMGDLIETLDRLFGRLFAYVHDEDVRSTSYNVPMLPFVQKIRSLLFEDMTFKFGDILRAWRAFAYSQD